MANKITNNAWSTLVSAITTTATTITVVSGQGARFPVLTGPDYFYATLCDAFNTVEIVKATARSGDSMTVVRAQDGTISSTYASGDKFELRLVAAAFNDKLDIAVAATTFAPLASPVLTGAPTAPTALAGTNSLQISNTAFVSAAVAAQAFTTSLPSQTGNADKFVTTNGSTASWSSPLPAQSGNAGKFITTDGANASWQAAPVVAQNLFLSTNFGGF